MNNDKQITLEQLARLKEDAARANSLYDAARKAYKAQQKAQARALRPENPSRTDHLLSVPPREAGAGGN